MTPPTEPTEDAWAWPENPAGDLADLLEEAARALRDGRAMVHRSATSRSSPGSARIDVDVSWPTG